jgi:hypothetical protein
VIQAGEWVTMYSTRNGELGNAVMENRERFEFDVCYCSIYETCWRVGAGFSSTALPDPTPIDRCPAPGPESWID